MIPSVASWLLKYVCFIKTIYFLQASTFEAGKQMNGPALFRTEITIPDTDTPSDTFVRPF